MQVIELSDVAIAATSSHVNKTIYQADLNQPIAWLLGNEGQGIGEELLKKATMQLTIPHAGDMESLNVSAATAVCLFEQMRQQKFKG
jgi:TrmH family RNA methyltransferase